MDFAIKSAAVLGSGKTARDLGFFLWECGCKVTFVTVTERIAELDAAVKKKLRQTGSILGNNIKFEPISISNFQEEYPLEVSAVFECRFETLDAKSQGLAAVASRVKEDTLFLSNTSSILPHDLGSNIVSMHFFFPVALTKFVELIFPKNITDEKRCRVTSLAESLKLKYVIQSDDNAFWTNRLLLPLQAETIRLLLLGADKTELDEASKAQLLSVGQIFAADEIGIDILYEGVKNYANRMPLYEASDYKELLSALSRFRDAGILGKKNNRTLRKHTSEELKAAAKEFALTNSAKMPACLKTHFNYVFINNCYTFLEKAQCTKDDLNTALSSVFGAEETFEESASKLETDTVKNYLAELYTKTGLFYFKPSRLWDKH